MVRIIIIISICFLALNTTAQDTIQGDTIKRTIQKMVIDGDTVDVYVLPEFEVDPDYYDKWRRMAYFTQRVYEYAMIVKDLDAKFDKELAELKNDRARRKYIRKANKELKKEFTDEVKKMSETRGKLLCKIIHKETGNTAYDIIKKFKSGFTARIWQTAAQLGGADLKYKFEPDDNEDDKMLEDILEEIENGKIAIIPREKVLEEYEEKEKRKEEERERKKKEKKEKKKSK